tara:strand:+ start:115 stop:744 length:630 start_codon:yes stop_codon:yes gene_type:complete
MVEEDSIGTISDDGEWIWNGSDWVPYESPPNAPRELLVNPVIVSDTVATKPNKIKINYLKLGIIGGVVLMLLAASLVYLVLNQEERKGMGVYVEWQYMCAEDCGLVWVKATGPYEITDYEGYKPINDDDWGPPIQEEYWLWEDEIYSLSGITQRESSELSFVAIIGTVSTKGFDRGDACVIFSADDYDNYATAGDVGFFTTGTLVNNDC